MEALLTVAACSGLIAAGFSLGVWLYFRRNEREIALLYKDAQTKFETAQAEWKEALAKIQAINNSQTEKLVQALDRLGAVEMRQSAVRK